MNEYQAKNMTNENNNNRNHFKCSKIRSINSRIFIFINVYFSVKKLEQKIF